MIAIINMYGFHKKKQYFIKIRLKRTYRFFDLILNQITRQRTSIGHFEDQRD